MSPLSGRQFDVSPAHAGVVRMGRRSSPCRVRLADEPRDARGGCGRCPLNVAMSFQALAGAVIVHVHGCWILL